MSLQFTQEEVEAALADILQHGDRVEVARISGLSESYIKRQFNPDDHEAVSCAFRLLQVACALDEIDGTKGERFWRTIGGFRASSKMLTDGLPNIDLDVETGKLGKEIADFINSRLSRKPKREQLRELIEAKEQLDAMLSPLMAEEPVN